MHTDTDESQQHNTDETRKCGAFGLVPKYPNLNHILFRDIYTCGKHITEVRKTMNTNSD